MIQKVGQADDWAQEGMQLGLNMADAWTQELGTQIGFQMLGMAEGTQIGFNMFGHDNCLNSNAHRIQHGSSRVGHTDRIQHVWA